MLKEKIKEMRKESGQTQAKLAELCDVSSTHISNIEAGREKPSLELLQRMATAFGCELYIDFIHKGAQPNFEQQLALEEIVNKPHLTFENAPARTMLAIVEAKLEIEFISMTEAEKQEILQLIQKCKKVIVTNTDNL